MEHRSGLIVYAVVTPADGYGERYAGLEMVAHVPGDHRITVAGDKAYCDRFFVGELRHLRATPHVAQYADTSRRHSAIDARTTRHPGYVVSQ